MDPSAVTERDVHDVHTSSGLCCQNETDFKKICNHCIKQLLDHYKPICQKIKNGACKSRRHRDYLSGGKAKRDLSFQINSMRVFSDEAHEVTENWLRKEFCKDGNPAKLDYCLRVLQMELFIRIFMRFTHCSYDEAEDKMINWSKC